MGTVRRSSHHGYANTNRQSARPPVVGAGQRRLGAIPRRGRCVHRQRRDTVDPHRPPRRRGRDPGGHRGLPDCLRRAGDHRWPSRRHRWAQARVHRRRSWLHTGLAVVRAVRIGADADLCARGAGRCRGDDGAAGARLDPHAVPRRRTRARLHDLRSRDRPGRRRWLHARRLAGDAQPRRSWLAQHLLRQRAGRHRHRARRRMAYADHATQHRHTARSARRRRAVRRIARTDRAADVRARTWLAVVDVDCDGRGVRGACRLRAPPAPCGTPWRHAADRPGTARGSHLRRRHGCDVLLLSWQPVVLLRADAVHPERSPLLAVRRSTHGDAAGIRICRRFAAEWRAADRRLRRAGHRACGNGPAGRLGNAAYDRHADGAARRVRLRSGHGAGAAVQCGADPGATRPRRVRSRHLDHDAAGGEWHRSCAGGSGVLCSAGPGW